MCQKFKQKQFKKDTHLEDFENLLHLALKVSANYLKSQNRAADTDHTTTIEEEETEDPEAEASIETTEEALDPKPPQVDSQIKALNGELRTPSGTSERQQQLNQNPRPV